MASSQAPRLPDPFHRRAGCPLASLRPPSAPPAPSARRPSGWPPAPESARSFRPSFGGFTGAGGASGGGSGSSSGTTPHGSKAKELDRMGGRGAGGGQQPQRWCSCCGRRSCRGQCVWRFRRDQGDAAEWGDGGDFAADFDEDDAAGRGRARRSPGRRGGGRHRHAADYPPAPTTTRPSETSRWTSATSATAAAAARRHSSRRRVQMPSSSSSSSSRVPTKPRVPTPTAAC